MTSTPKFGRIYRLTVTPNDGGAPIVIELPFTVNFWVERNTMANLNRASIDIYNLSEAHRSQIFQDRFALSPNRYVTIEVGYGQLYRVYYGRIFEASSSREGTNIITRIESQDGQFDIAASIINQTLPAGTTQKQLLTTLAGQFPNVKLANIGNFPTVFNRPIALNGNVWELIQLYSGNNAYIDNGQLYILNKNEVPVGQILTLDDPSGLLQTPRREGTFVNITTLMEPSINIGNLVNLVSTVNPIYNTQYQVIGIRHQGMISQAACGRAISNFSLLHPGIFGQPVQVPPV